MELYWDDLQGEVYEKCPGCGHGSRLVARQDGYPENRL